MKYKDWDDYGQTLKEIMTNEIFIILSFFGGSSFKFLKDIQQEWFASRDLKEFKSFLDKVFNDDNNFEEETERDEITFSLRLSTLCDVFTNFESVYLNAITVWSKNKDSQIEQLDLLFICFQSFFKNIGRSLNEETKLLTIPAKYKVFLNNICKTIQEYLVSDDFNSILDHTYIVNEMISDLLEMLEEDPENSGKFSSESEVLLYNFSICYSTMFYFSILLFEKLIEIEEWESNTVRLADKPISEENESRMAEAQVVGSNGEEIFYKTLKN